MQNEMMGDNLTLGFFFNTLNMTMNCGPLVHVYQHNMYSLYVLVENKISNLKYAL